MTDPSRPAAEPTEDDVRAFLAEPEIAMVLDGLGARYTTNALLSCLIAGIEIPEQLGVTAEVLRKTPGIEHVITDLTENMTPHALNAIAQSANGNWDAVVAGAHALRLGHAKLQELAEKITSPSDAPSTEPG